MPVAAADTDRTIAGRRAALSALACEARPDGRQNVPLDRVPATVALPERVAHSGKPRLVVVATKQMGETNLAGLHSHGRARDRRLAEIEGSAIAADTAAHHHEPGRNRPQLDIARRIDHGRETVPELCGMRLRQQRHRGPAPDGIWCRRGAIGCLRLGHLRLGHCFGLQRLSSCL